MRAQRIKTGRKTQGKNGTEVPATDRADRWGLADLRAVWAERRAAARVVCARIDTTGMTRRPRDPVEREWLAARGLLGPFDKR